MGAIHKTAAGEGNTEWLARLCMAIAIAFVSAACAADVTPVNDARSSTPTTASSTTTATTALAATDLDTSVPNSNGPGPTRTTLNDLAPVVDASGSPIRLSLLVERDGEYLGLGIVNFERVAFRSADGVTWTTEPVRGLSSDPTATLAGFHQADDGFLATLYSSPGGRNDRIRLLRSPDMVNWIEEDLPDVRGNASSVTQSGDRIAVMSFADGVSTLIVGEIGGPYETVSFPYNWAHLRPPLAGTAQGFMAVVNPPGETPGQIISSTDLNTWTTVTPPSEPALRIRDVAVRDNTVVFFALAAGDDDTPETLSTWATSDLGATWTSSEVPTDFPRVSFGATAGQAGFAIYIGGRSFDEPPLPDELWFSSEGTQWSLVNRFPAIQLAVEEPYETTNVGQQLAGVGASEILISTIVRKTDTGDELTDLVFDSSTQHFLEALTVG